MPLSKVAIVYAQVSGRVDFVFRMICTKIYDWVYTVQFYAISSSDSILPGGMRFARAL